MKRVMFVLALIALVACDGNRVDSPAAVVKARFEAFARLDLGRVRDLTCDREREALDQTLNEFGGAADLESMADRIQIDVSGLTYTEKSAGSQDAIVHISGALKVSTLGNTQQQSIDTDVPAVMEDGAWKVCSADLPGGN